MRSANGLLLTGALAMAGPGCAGLGVGPPPVFELRTSEFVPPEPKPGRFETVMTFVSVGVVAAWIIVAGSELRAQDGSAVNVP